MCLLLDTTFLLYIPFISELDVRPGHTPSKSHLILFYEMCMILPSPLAKWMHRRTSSLTISLLIQKHTSVREEWTFPDYSCSRIRFLMKKVTLIANRGQWLSTEPSRAVSRFYFVLCTLNLIVSNLLLCTMFFVLCMKQMIFSLFLR